MSEIVSPAYRDNAPDVRPCLTCGASTAPGQPGHRNSTVDYIDHLCYDHDADGVRGVNCLECVTEPIYFCGEHSDVVEVIIDLEPGRSDA